VEDCGPEASEVEFTGNWFRCFLPDLERGNTIRQGTLHAMAVAVRG